jgi:glutamyl-tRNA reductase
MTLKYTFGESLEDWASRVEKFEYGLALQRIAKSEPLEVVMEDMARRISQKMVHAMLTNFKKSRNIDYDVAESRRLYEENYLKKIGRRADHVFDERFIQDNPASSDL